MNRKKAPYFLTILVFLLFLASASWAGDLSGSATYNYSRQEEDDETFFSSETFLRLNWNTALSNSDMMNFYGMYFREDISDPETENIRPSAGLTLSGQKYRWLFEYRELEQKNLGDNSFTKLTKAFFTTFNFNAGDEYPDLAVDFARTQTADDLEEPEVDFTQTDWGVRTTYSRDPLSFRYSHRENDFDNHLTFLITKNFQVITGVATDPSGTIYLSDSSANRIYRLSPSGTFLSEFGSTGAGEGQFNIPLGIDVNEQSIYVADSENHRIQRLSKTGDFISEWGTLGFGPGEFNTPYGVAVDETGVYVSDRENDRIQKFTLDGGFLFTIGTIGSGSGNFSSPGGIASNGDLVFVADTLNNRIQVFDTDGTFITEWGTFGSAAGQFQFPTDVAIDSIDHIYVSDTGNNRIQVFTTAGVFLDEFGSTGSGDAEFNDPRGIAVTFADEIAVVDAGNNRLKVLTNTGLLRFQVGSVTPEERARSSERTLDAFNFLYGRQLSEGVYASVDYDLFRSRERDKDSGTELVSVLSHDINAQLRLKPYRWMSFTSMLRMENSDTETSDLNLKQDELTQTYTLSLNPIRKVNATAGHTRSSRDNSAGFDQESVFTTLGCRFIPMENMNISVGYSTQQNDQDGEQVTEIESFSAITNMKIYRGADLNVQLSSGQTRDFRTKSEVDSQRVRSRLKLLLRPRLTLNTSAEYNTSDSRFLDAPTISSHTLLGNVDLLWGIGDRLDLLTDLNYIRVRSADTIQERLRYFSQLIWRMNSKLSFFMGYRGSSVEENVFSFRTQARFPFVWETRMFVNVTLEKGEQTDRKYLLVGLSRIL